MIKQLRTIRFHVIVICFAILFTGCAEDRALRERQAQAKRNLGKSFLADANFTAGLKELLDAAELDPMNPEIHNELALTYREMEMHSQAISHFNKAIELKPDFSEAYNNLGTVYLMLGDWDRAIASFKKALSNNRYTTPHFAHNNLGLAYFNKGQFKTATESFLKAIQGQPSFSRAYHNLGVAYEAMNEWDKALKVYQESIRHAPDDPRSYFRLGKLYLRLNNRPLAIEKLEEAIRLDKTNVIAPEAKGLLEKIR